MCFSANLSIMACSSCLSASIFVILLCYDHRNKINVNVKFKYSTTKYVKLVLSLPKITYTKLNYFFSTACQTCRWKKITTNLRFIYFSNFSQFALYRFYFFLAQFSLVLFRFCSLLAHSTTTILERVCGILIKKTFTFHV